MKMRGRFPLLNVMRPVSSRVKTPNPSTSTLGEFRSSLQMSLARSSAFIGILLKRPMLARDQFSQAGQMRFFTSSEGTNNLIYEPIHPIGCCSGLNRVLPGDFFG
jgi:hypothetical protein